MAYGSGWSSITELEQGQSVSNKFNSAFNNIDLALADIEIKLPDGYMQFTPQQTPPVGIVEGAMFYDLPSHSFVAIDDIVGTRLNLGHELDERVFNPSGTVIPEGIPLRVISGVSDGALHIEPSSAADLDTATVLGFSTSEIPVGGVGKIVKIGRANGVDTKGIAANEPIFLSETVGEITGTPPEIITIIGYVITPQSAVGVADGVVYVSPRSIIALPNVVGFMNQDTPTISAPLNDNLIAVTNYDANDNGKVIVDIDIVAGTAIAPAIGIYDISADFDISFTPTTAAVRHIIFEVIENDGGVISTVTSYIKEMHKSAEGSSASFTKTFNGKKDAVYHLAYRAGLGESFADFVLNSVSFSLKSIDIR